MLALVALDDPGEQPPTADGDNPRRLIDVAARNLREVLGEADAIACVGPGELAILCNCDPRSAPAELVRPLADRLSSACRPNLTGSGVRIGIAVATGQHTTPELLIETARRTMTSIGDAPRVQVAPPIGDGGLASWPTRRAAARVDTRVGSQAAPLHEAEGLIRELYVVALRLSSCATAAGGPDASQVAEAADALDQIIQRLRLHGVARPPRRWDSMAGQRHELLEQLDATIHGVRHVADVLDRLATCAAHDGTDAFELLEAAYSSHGAANAMHRARQAIATQPARLQSAHRSVAS